MGRCRCSESPSRSMAWCSTVIPFRSVLGEKSGTWDTNGGCQPGSNPVESPLQRGDRAFLVRKNEEPTFIDGFHDHVGHVFGRDALSALAGTELLHHTSSLGVLVERDVGGSVALGVDHPGPY